MSLNRSNAVTLAAVAALAFWGCGGDNLGTEKPVSSVSVTPTTSTLTPGGTVQLQAATKDADGAVLTGREITWSSSDNSVATVSPTGLVAGVADGSAMITASSEGRSGSAVIAVATPGALNFAAVTAGYVHTCGVTAGGAAYCWGYNGAGQLGIGTTNGPESCGPPDPHLSVACSTVPLPVAGGISFAALSAGESHTCGLTAAGAAYCWGSNDDGQLGSGSAGNASPVPVAVTGGLRFTGVSAGGTHTCGVTTSGAAYCWGLNVNGRLGDGSTDASAVPVAVTGGFSYSQAIAAGLASGEGHSCGLTTAGAAYCWGGNEFGQLGEGSNSDKTTPAPVTGEFTFSAVAGGAWHTCGITTSGVAYCWGANGHGQLGDGSNTYVSAPVAVVGGVMFSTMTAGAVHNCGATQGGAAYCWGESEHGELGNGSTTASSVPVAVLGGLSFTTLAAGTFHTCGISSGTVYCWGLNSDGQLGEGSKTNSTLPVRVVVR
jgi:alpha-tubulin suppressor-like RCC1 family protein